MQEIAERVEAGKVVIFKSIDPRDDFCPWTVLICGWRYRCNTFELALLNVIWDLERLSVKN
jgi:hypothetical protein